MLMPELPYPSKTTKGDNDWNKIYETRPENLRDTAELCQTQNFRLEELWNDFKVDSLQKTSRNIPQKALYRSR